MTSSKNWESRKAVIAPYHIPLLQRLSEQTGIDSLSDAVNFLISEYRKQQYNQSEPKSEFNSTSTTIDDSDDFGLNPSLL